MHILISLQIVCDKGYASNYIIVTNGHTHLYQQEAFPCINIKELSSC